MVSLEGSNPSADAVTLCDSQVVVVLKIKPKLRGQTEVLPQANGSAGTDAPLSPDDLIDARKIEGLRQFMALNPIGSMNSVLRISPAWTANTFFGLDMVGALLKCTSEIR